jgi:hypothetical protein
MMTSAWKNARNCLDFDKKAELQICVNIAKECSRFTGNSLPTNNCWKLPVMGTYI